MINLNKKTGLIVGSILLLLICGAVYLLSHKDTSSRQLSRNSTTATSNRLYTSAKHRFSVNFPGDPTVSNSYLLFKQGEQDIRVPFTIYKKDDGNADYEVIVYDYPSAFDLSKNIDARLQAAIDGSVQNFKSASLVSSSFGQFAGQRSISGVVSVDVDGTTRDVYEIAFLKGNSLYLLLAIDASQASFNAFADTFKLIQK